MSIERLLKAMIQFQASDLHLQVGSPPELRIHGTLTALDMPPLTSDGSRGLFDELADEPARNNLADKRSADFSHYVPDLSRFRINAFYERGNVCLAIRAIPLKIPLLEELRLPRAIPDIATAERGLVLVTGTTGSGKSTTLAAMIDLLNRTKRLRIITIEDPIEFVHTSQKCLIAQREVFYDSIGFADSLRGALRQDPDVILVGELRDSDTMRTALQAADTGHLVLSTLHTTNAAQTVQRLFAMFPPDERDLLQLQLAANLEAVISQRLAKAKAGGRVAVVEIMRDTPIVRKLLFEGRVESLPQSIAGGDAGMQLFDQHLVKLYQDDAITGTEALRLASNPETVALAMRGISTGDSNAVLSK